MSAAPFELRASGVPSAGTLPWGSHFCVFYNSEAEVLDIVVPFIKAGLESNELCSWEVSSLVSRERATEALANAIPDFARYVALGQIEIQSATEACNATMREDESLERRLDQAILAGFDGLRLACHAGAKGQSFAVIAGAVRRLNVIAAVLYPRAEIDALSFMQVVQDHRFALVCNSGRWDILEGSEARSAREALERTEEKLESLFRNMSEAFAYHRIVLDRRGEPCDYVFLDMNPAFGRLTGLDYEHIRGKRVTEVLPGIQADPTDWIGKYGRVALTGNPIRFESYAASLDRWYVVSAFSPHKGYFAVTFTDITERKHAEQERERLLGEVSAAKDALRAANAQLMEADRAKNEFLAVLSHELRNPLAPIKAGLYILDHAAPGGDQARRAQGVITRQVDQLARLVDDLLDVTRIARNKVQLQRQRLELNDLARRTIEDHRSLFETAGVGIDLHPARAPIFVDADWNRLAQVLGNLLQNAAKFTPRGGRVSIELGTDAGNRATVRVADTGVGMTSDMLGRVFQPFTQADATLDRSRGGLGLGLALVKGLVELHGGEVTATSPGPGRGSEFVIRLPIAASRTADAKPVTAIAPAVRHRVLVIEDNLDSAEMLREVLEFGQHEVAVANNGADGIARAREFRPDVVVCDIGLPGISGYQVARMIRADQSLRGAYLVALSGYALPEDVQRSIEAGFDRHLAKPPSLEKLQEVLASIPPAGHASV